MYTTILYLLVAVAIQSISPPTIAQHWHLIDLLPIVGLTVGAWLLARWRFRRMMASALNSGTRADRLRPTFTRALQTGQALMLVPFALLTFTTQYPALVVHPVAPTSEMLAGALGLAPLLAFWLLLWREAYPLHVVLFGRSGSRGAFVGGHARMNFPLIAPWLVVVTLNDIFRWVWPAGYEHLQTHPALELLYLPIFLVGVAALMPVLVQSLWGCTPLEEGPLRDRLEKLLASQKVRVRQIVLWPILEGKVLTAGVVGPMARFRYLLLTPALLQMLDDAELDGVVAHEAGHVRHHHLWFYLLFFAAFVIGMVGIYFRLAVAAATWVGSAWPEALTGPLGETYLSAAFSGGLIAGLIIAFRFGFGSVSRAFERQADLFALETLGDAQPLVSALETIGLHSGNIRDLPSWHHGSIAERSQFLTDAQRDPTLIAEHHGWVRRLRHGLTLLLVGVGALAVTLHLPSVEEHLYYTAAQSGLEYRLRTQPNDVMGWIELGILRQQWEKDGPAVEAFREALGLSPSHPEALNALAWLHATSENETFHDPARALFLARRAVNIKPAPHIFDTLAEAHFANGDVESALRAIDTALAANPPNRDYYEGQRRRFLTHTP